MYASRVIFQIRRLNKHNTVYIIAGLIGLLLVASGGIYYHYSGSNVSKKTININTVSKQSNCLLSPSGCPLGVQSQITNSLNKTDTSSVNGSTNTATPTSCTQHSCLSCTYVLSVADAYLRNEIKTNENYYQENTSSQAIGLTDQSTQAQLILEAKNNYNSAVLNAYANYLQMFDGLNNPCSPDISTPSTMPLN